MTTNTAKKHLEEIETHLTPKEQAIRLADETRKYPGMVTCMKALVKLPYRELPMQRPFYAFEKQAAERHPGHGPEDIRARHHLTHKLWREFHKLGLLMRDVNLAMQQKVESLGLQVALQLSALHALILQDAFTHTAKQAAALLAAQNQRRTKKEREAVLKQLAAFTEADIDEAPPDCLPFQIAAPSPLEEWSQETTALLKDFYAHRAAVELVQAQHFDGHPILFMDLEAELTEASRTIESAVATANEYLNRRAGRDGAGADESKLAIALETIKAGAKGKRAAAIAEKWHRNASHEAIESDEEKWERCRAEFGAT